MRVLRVIVACVFVALLLHRGCAFVEASWFRSLMPESLEAGEAAMVRDVGALREGCGVAIFKLGDKALARIESEGLAYLGDQWTETPYVDGGSGSGSWMTGMNEGCGDLPDEMRSQVSGALASPGAYYRVGHEKGYIVIPRLGWAILSFFG